MSNWLSYTQEERLVILQQTSDHESLPDYAIEKDWWVTMVLKAASHTKCADSLLFKGGTSLSKGWNLIKRFSEDIDLALDHKFFRDNIENNNQLKTLRKECRKYIVDQWANDLDERLRDMGLRGYAVYPQTEIDGNPVSSDADPTVVIIEYQPITGTQSSYITPMVKVEISCLSMSEPFEQKAISSMIHNAFPDADSESTAMIPTVLPSRTFLEKAFLLCEEFQKESPRSLRMSRHLYDLYMLMDTEFGKAALSDDKLYAAIVEHRRKFYHVSYADYDKDYRDRIEFCPPQHCIKAWEADYANMCTSMIYGERPSFSQLMERIEQLQARFRFIAQ